MHFLFYIVLVRGEVGKYLSAFFIHSDRTANSISMIGVKVAYTAYFVRCVANVE